MRQSIVFVFFFVAGCGSGVNSKPDIDAARGFLKSLNRYADIDLIEEPEYAIISKTPPGHNVNWPNGRDAACGVRIKFTARDGNRTTHDDWVIWVTSDHTAIDWVGNANGDKWRQYVRSFAKK